MRYAPVTISVAGAAAGADASDCDAPAAAAGALPGAAAAMGMYHSGPNPASALAASLNGGCTNTTLSEMPWHAGYSLTHSGICSDKPGEGSAFIIAKLQQITMHVAGS